MTITFKNRTYTVVNTIKPNAVLVADGMEMQYVIEGKKGATFLLQEFNNGIRRTVSPTGRVEIEYPAN